MSKMNDMAMTIEELRNAATAIADAADWLAKQFSVEVEKQPTEEAAAKPEPQPQLTLEQVRAVLADKSRAGHTSAVRELLLKYGASKLSQIDPVNYEALLGEAEVLGDAT
ncbi:MAG: DNA ligase [Anaerovoracaceae bacterium]